MSVSCNQDFPGYKIIEYKNTELSGLSRIVIFRPTSNISRKEFDDFHQNLIHTRDQLKGGTMIIDLSNLTRVPFPLVAVAFALKEELMENNFRLIITGIKKEIISRNIWQKCSENLSREARK
jgi:anti-anti-sigma regulatory factor